MLNINPLIVSVIFYKFNKLSDRLSNRYTILGFKVIYCVGKNLWASSGRIIIIMTFIILYFDVPFSLDGF